VSDDDSGAVGDGVVAHGVSQPQTRQNVNHKLARIL
jgi:hypothetical protein